MSAEAPISLGPATGSVGIAGGVPSLGSEMSMPGTKIDSGGTNLLSMNNDIFSMPELIAPPAEALNFDRTVPGNLAFTHTDILPNTSYTPKTEAFPFQVPTTDILETPQAEVMQETAFSPIANPYQINNALNGLVADTPPAQIVEYITQADEQFVNVLPKEAENTLSEAMDETEVISSLTFQEVEADMQQAAKVQDALIAIGIPVEEAEERSTAVFEETLVKKGISEVLTEQSIAELVQLQEQYNPELKEKTKTQTTIATEEENKIQTKKAMLPQTKEKFFERDTNADKAREELAKKAIAIAFKKPLFSKEVPVVNGADLVNNMPSRPQPSSIKSEIIQGPIEDGSYAEIVKDIAYVGEIFSANEAIRIVDKAIAEKPAVRLRERKSSNSVTMNDVKRVIRKENVIEFKT